MSRRKRSDRSRRRRRSSRQRCRNKTIFKTLLNWLVSADALFMNDRFHGNIKWKPAQLAAQAAIWAWQESRNVTDAFDQTLEICQELGIESGAKTYTAFINALEK